MLTKSLIFLLLGSTLILASPVQQIEEQRVKRSFLGSFSDWLDTIDDTISSITDRVKQPFTKVYNSVLEKSESIVGYGKDKLNQLLKKYYQLKNKSEENINNAKNAFFTKVITELQKVIDTLSEEADRDNLKKLKVKTQEIAESGKEALEKLQKQLQEAIDAEKLKLEQNLGKWEEEAEEVVKHRKY